MNSYLLFKSLHLIAVVSWMAGLLYLPRIFVYHVENKEKKEATDIFEVMEKRLFFYIMRPAMIFTWVFGLVLIYLNGIDIFSQLWLLRSFVCLVGANFGKRWLHLRNKTPHGKLRVPALHGAERCVRGTTAKIEPPSPIRHHCGVDAGGKPARISRACQAQLTIVGGVAVQKLAHMNEGHGFRT